MCEKRDVKSALRCEETACKFLNEGVRCKHENSAFKKQLSLFSFFFFFFLYFFWFCFGNSLFGSVAKRIWVTVGQVKDAA